ncbi:MAG: ABC transporter permease [Candidatus Neomarinimicrobiota bacterium]|jgi:peptide/nickel transport system permease protein|nr:ABC transporter permease [Candidatus Neomarinimicrobiota bacterium]|tara:strand:- start:6006 stop:6992 length:987 start_codon:yes stop_codon:yes gene_type:complete
MNPSLSYILSRLWFYLIAAWAAITLNFFIPRMMPGDPASVMFANLRGKLKPEALEALKKTFGVTDEPLITQYLDYIKLLFQGDLGISIAYFPQQVSSIIISGLLWTLFLVGTSLIISFIIGSILGIFIAWNRDEKIDSILPPSFALLSAFPYFFTAMILLYIFGFKFGMFPIRHAYSSNLNPELSFEFIGNVIYHAILPASTLIFMGIGGWMLGMRNNMIGTISTDYISYAKSRGISNKKIMFNYAARNAILPVVTSFGMALGFALNGAILTEIIFSYPGQGYILFEAVKAQDFQLMQGIFLTITLSVLAANWIIDIVILILDPRTRK